MRLFCAFFIGFVFAFSLCGQTPLFTETFTEVGNSGTSEEGIGWSASCANCDINNCSVGSINGSISNGNQYETNNNDGTNYWESDPIDISKATSLSFSIDYSSSQDWAGDGNMEEVSDCPPFGVGNCPGDPFDGLSGDCICCWDFFYYEVIVDGSVLFSNLVGGAGSNPQFMLFQDGPTCVDGNTATIRVLTQTWAQAESIFFDDVTLVAWEAAPDASTINPICDGSTIDLFGSAEDETIVNSWSWSSDGGAIINNPSSQNTQATNGSTGETFTLQVTDVNGCTATDELVIFSIPGPTAIDPIVTACLGELVPDLGDYNLVVNPDPTLTFEWYDGNPTMGGILINPTTNFMTSSVLVLYVQVEDTDGCITSIPVTINTPLPPTAVDPIIDYCSGSTVDLQDYNSTVNPDNTLTFEWYDGDPNAGGIGPLSNTNIDLNTVTDLWVVATNMSGCDTAIPVTTNILGAPMVAFGGDVDLCTGTCTSPGMGLTFSFVGGAAPYTLSLQITSPINFNLPAAAFNVGESIQICSQGILPGFNPITNVLTIPEVLTGNLSIDLLNATDANGCIASLGLDQINVTISDIPTVNDPNLPSGCAASFDPFDLTAFNVAVNGTQTVNWYIGNPNSGGVIISNPASTDLDPMPDLWVEVVDPVSMCSDILNINEPLISAGPEVFFLSVLEDVCPGDCILIPLEITNGLAPYTISFTSSFLINNVLDDYSFELDFGSTEFELEVCLQSPGNLQSENDFTNTILIPSIATSGQIVIDDITDVNACQGLVDLPDMAVINVNPAPAAFASSLTVCDIDNDGQAFFDLTMADEDINNNTGLAVNYYSNAAGTIPVVSANNFLAVDGQIVYAQVLQNPCVSSIVELSLSIEEPLFFATPPDVTVCSEYTLPTINFISGTSSDAIYSDGPFASNNSYIAGSPIFTGGTYYIYDPLYGNCQNNPSFQVTIDPPLTAGLDVVTSICENSIVDLNNLLNDASLGGFFLDSGNAPVADPTMISSTGVPAGTSMIFTYNVDNILPCQPDQATITINVSTGVDAGNNENQFICSGSSIDLTSVLSSTATLGGVFTDDDLTSALIGNDFNSTSLALGQYNFTYTVGGGSCPVSTALISITVDAGPSIDAIAEVDACGSIFTLQAITGIGLSGSEAYFTMPGGTGDMYLAGDNITSSQILYAYDSSGSCTSEQEFMINILAQPVAGNDGIIQPCLGYGIPLDLSTLLSAQADLGGVWSELSSSGIDLTNPFAVDISAFSGTDISLQYSVVNGTCSDQAMIDIQWLPAPVAGVDFMTDLCNNVSDFDLNASIGVHDMNGLWSQIQGPSVDIADSTSVDFTSLNAGTFIFEYSTQAEMFCGAQTATVTIDLSDNPDASVSQGVSVCAGSMVSLFDYVTGDNTGEFFDVSNVTVVSSGMINTTTLLGNYDFIYTVNDPAGICLPSSETLTITVANGVSAGTDVPAYDVCVGESLNIFDLFSDADGGGTFTIISGEGSVNGVTYTTATAPTTTQVLIQYSVGDNIICLEDNSMIELNVVSPPELILTPLLNPICPGTCADFTVTLSGMPPVQYVLRFSSSNGQSLSLNFTPVTPVQNITLCNDNGVLNLDNVAPLGDATGIWQVEVVSFEDANCSVSNSIEMFDFNPNAGEIAEVVNPQLCVGESIIVNGVVYDVNNQTGNEMITNPTGCDTLYMIDLQFTTTIAGILDGTYCSDASFTLGSETFDINNPSGVATLIGQSVQGCDSTVNVSLSFFPPAIGFDNMIYCADDEVTIGGTVFNINNPMGEVIFSGQSSSGCDSLLMVDLEFVNETFNNVSSSECADYQVTINNTIYNIDNPSGMDTLVDGNARGCDSIIIVDFNFYPEAVGFYTEVLCPDEETVINGETFNQNNLSSIQLMPGMSTNGCDSTLNVQVTYTDLIADLALTVLVTNTSYDMTLDIDGAYNNITWSPAEGLSCVDCLTTMASPTQSTTYTATIEYGDACTLSLDQEIIIDQNIPSVYIPNVFSPNGDGVNDVFRVYPSDEDMFIVNFSIYDRWGEQVFRVVNVSSDDPSAGWDGIFKGQLASLGVYVYTIQMASISSEEVEVLSGDITLMR